MSLFLIQTALDYEQRLHESEAHASGLSASVVQKTNEVTDKDREISELKRKLGVEIDKNREEKKRRKVIHKASLRVQKIVKPKKRPTTLEEALAVLDSAAGEMAPALKEMGPV